MFTKKSRLNQIYSSVYNPALYSSKKPIKLQYSTITEALFKKKHVYYYPYGRFALQNGLEALGIQKGDRILLPGFICRDLLSSIVSLGALPIFYKVDEKLLLAEELFTFKGIKAVIAVNYFGFPQELSPFKEFTKKEGIPLIEDNAHGFLSCSEDGVYLGTRTDIGIFSIRKTLPIYYGAALLINEEGKLKKTLQQNAFSTKKKPLSFLVKKGIRHLVPLFGPGFILASIYATRQLRKWRYGYEIAPSAKDAEERLPTPGQLSYSPVPDINSSATWKERDRRRDLYAFSHSLLNGVEGVKPIYGLLPDHIVPYAYPFFANSAGIDLAKKILRKYYLECFPWPELPTQIQGTAPSFYKSVWAVRFLW